MFLKNRNYTKILCDAEKEALQSQIEYDNKKGPKTVGTGPRFVHPNIEIREFLWRYQSDFPNNLLWHLELRNLNLDEEANLFEKIVYDATNENDIQTYIKGNQKWFIPGSIFKDFTFGHHAAFLFPEQQLANKYVVDYMLCGRNSDGYHLVLVEFEKANVKFIIESYNSETESVRKGISQIRDWKRWVDSNRDYLLKDIGIDKLGVDIPSHRIHYCLVVSRRDLMTDTAYDVKSQMQEEQGISIITYDRIVDYIRLLKNGY